jgi:DNA segregation ATPase FtsK/SpoIIIE-like protein
LWPWRDRLTDLATTPPEADLLLVRLRQLIHDRSHWLQTHGHRKWEPRFGPFVLVVVDELAELQALDATALAAAVTQPSDASSTLRAGRDAKQVRVGLLGSLARLARFCGVTIVAATQYPSAEVVDQQIRTQLTLRIMLRVASAEQVAVVLGQGHTTTVTPTSISPTERGGLWIAGLPGTATPIRARAHWVSNTDVTKRVTRTRHLTPTTDQVFGPETGEETGS